MWNPTPVHRLVDEKGVPYFLKGLGMTLEQFQFGLRDPAARDRLVLILLARARPDDVFSFLAVEEVLEIWPRLETHLESQAQWEFWAWLTGKWETREAGHDPEWGRPCFTDGGNVCRWSSCAEPATEVTHRREAAVEGFSLAANSLQESLVSTLCALDASFDVKLLANLKVLFESGGQLRPALMDIPCRVAEFSPVLLAWRLHNQDLDSLGLKLDLNPNEAQRLKRFNTWLVKRILDLSRPSDSIS